ncbi:MAG: hypothetical protein J6T96_14560, partial [Bacteroidales bacterium]|nr:hypothetical protein [Bacteroidales bacterium]
MAKRISTKNADTKPSVAAKPAKPKIHLAIMDDHWLDPVQDDIIARYERFQRKKKELESYYPTFVDFAGQYKYLGLNYSEDEHGWWMREWAPAAKEMYIFGDFNNWNRYQYPLKRRDDGIWEIFLDDKTFAKTFVHGSL